jgi:probable HAF family extracellular repeat protein
MLALAALAVIPAFAQTRSAAATPSFSVAEIYSFGGNPGDVMATGINDSGQVTGSAYLADSVDVHAFLYSYSTGVTQDLGTLGGSESYGTGINNAGEVVGFSDASGNNAIYAFLYRNGVMHNLDRVLGADGNSSGIAINTAGEILGGGPGGVFLLSHGVVQYLTSPAGPLGALALNDAGEVLGTIGSENSTAHAFLYSNGVVNDLGTLGGSSSVGTALNKSGQVTGCSYTAGGGPEQAFLYSSGVMQNLGSLFMGEQSCGNAINASGQITGTSGVFSTMTSVMHAFLYSDGVMLDLGTLGGNISDSDGEAINASGEVAGWYSLPYNPGGGIHAFLYSKGTLYDLNDLIAGSPLAPYVTLFEATAITDTGYILAEGVDSRNGDSWFVLHRNPVRAITRQE